MEFNFYTLRKKTRPYTIWSIVFLTYLAVGLNNKTNSLIVPLILTLLQFITYTVNRHWLIPKFYESQKRLYIIYNVIFITTSVCIASNISSHMIEPPEGIQPPSNDIFIYLFQVLLCLVALWIALNQHLIEKEKLNEKEIETLKRANLENNLQLLKSQINPHFLFNALNNIYTLSYLGDKKTPQKIDILSDMLRYVIYDCESEYVPIQKEIKYINNFIDFQQLKTEKKQNIEFINKIEDSSFLIAPMILIPFIENAFKHSKIERYPSHHVKITLEHRIENLYFTISNSILNNNMFEENKDQKGIGLENVINRLKIIYTNSYNLDISRTDNQFIVKLNIKTHES